MAYIRHDKDCKEASPQPTAENRTDQYGNSYDDWCGDYEPHDVDNNDKVWAPPPPGYSGPTGTFECNMYQPFTWVARYIDNTVRPVDSFVHNVTVFDPYVPTPENPLPVDETDIFFEIVHNGGQFALVEEVNNKVIIPEPSTDVVLTGAYTTQ